MVGDYRNPSSGQPVPVGRVRSVAERSVNGAVLTAALMFLLVFAGVAQAAPELIAGSGTGAGQVLMPRGTAVHQGTGDIYVADYNFAGSEGSTARINKFDSDGNFLLAWGWGVADKSEELQTCGPEAVPPTSNCVTSPNASSNPGPGAINPNAVAVDQSSGAVYVVDGSRRRVTKFSSTGQFLFMVGKEVNLGGGTPSTPGNICTAEHLANGDTCGVGGFGAGPNEFTNPLPLAVDSSGVVWVGDENRIASFNSSGAAGSEIALAGCGNVESLALDSAGNFFVKCSLLEGIRKLEAGTGTPLETLDAAGQPRTVTLDEADNVYIGDATSPYRFKVYNPAGEQIQEFGAGQVIGEPKGNALAIGESAERLYVASNDPDPPANRAVQAFSLPALGPLVEKQGAKDFLPTEATLTATINPEGDETTYRFEYGTSEGYGQSTPPATLAGGSFEGEEVAAQLKDLLPDTTYHFRVVATNRCNPSEPAEECTVQGEDQTFTTPPSVVISAQWASDVTASSAILHGELNPLGAKPDTEAWLEYGTDEGYGITIPLANLGDGFGAVTRQAFITGLQAATTYHFRFVARNKRDGIIYTVPGPDRTFTTQFGGLGFELADNRVWEMVSPPDKHGARLLGGGEVHLQASADGNGLAYQSKLSTETDPEGNRIPEASMNLARRDANGSWNSEDITTPNERASGAAPGNGTAYKLFSSDLSEALVDPRSDMLLSPEASDRTPYLRQNTDPPSYEPLVTGKEPFANVPPGIEFGGDKGIGGVVLYGASPNFEHFGLRSDVPLVEGSEAGPSTIYEWSNGQIKPVSVLPVAEGGTLVGDSKVGAGFGSVRGAISEDGSRVFWSGGAVDPEPSSSLYVRDTEAEETGRLDVVQADGGGEGEMRPIFQGASADGTVVFFTDSHRLTEDASPVGSDLYRCELPPGGVASGCATLTDISIPTEDGESADVQGIATAVTEDGESIYFVAEGVLDETLNDHDESAVSGAPNLYHWEQGEGVEFIARLSNQDFSVWGEAVGSDGQLGQLGASISPGGRYLAFMSERSLTEYDNRDASTGEPAQEVFRHDAFSGNLECVSCNPTGARPHGALAPDVGSLVNPAALWKGQWTAAVLPQATTLSLQGVSLYRPRAVLDNGRIFFNAVDSLVPADSNGQWDVYQYEPTGVGDCLASSNGASVSRAAGGCVSLLSSGTAEAEAAFFDASETGDDAFFFTPARLSVLDEDSEVDIYDARVNGVPATRPVFPECLGEACQPPPQAPSDPTPASAAFQGPGNLRPAARKKCPKGKRRVKRQGKVRCVPKKKQQSKKGKEGQRRADGDRGATR
jgi:DNA-binding beta-propeller fold protein YncE